MDAAATASTIYRGLGKEGWRDTYHALLSRPMARIMVSDMAVVIDLDGCPALMFRAANRRRNRILEVEVRVFVVLDRRSAEGHQLRSFRDLKTIRSRTPCSSCRGR